MRFWLRLLIVSAVSLIGSQGCHNWCDYGILNEDCECECISKHIIGNHCEEAKIKRCLVASSGSDCPQYYYCHADNDVCTRGLCSSGALGWCIPLPIAELRTNRSQPRILRSLKRSLSHRKHLRATRYVESV